MLNNSEKMKGKSKVILYLHNKELQINARGRLPGTKDRLVKSLEILGVI